MSLWSSSFQYASLLPFVLVLVFDKEILVKFLFDGKEGNVTFQNFRLSVGDLFNCCRL